MLPFWGENSQDGKKVLGVEGVYEKLDEWYVEVVKQGVGAVLEAHHSYGPQATRVARFRRLHE